MNNARRRSNSSTHATSLGTFKTKFEQIEPEPVFEEELHGPLGDELDKASTADSSGSGASIEEDYEEAKKM